MVIKNGIHGLALLGLAIEDFEFEGDEDFEPAFAPIAQSKRDGLIAFPDALRNFNHKRIDAFALRRRLPSIYGWKMYVEAGGLMSYGPVLDHVSVRVAGQNPKGGEAGSPAGRAANENRDVRQPHNLQGNRARNTGRTDPAR